MSDVKWWHCPNGHIFADQEGKLHCIGKGCDKEYTEDECVRDFKNTERLL